MAQRIRFNVTSKSTEVAISHIAKLTNNFELFLPNFVGRLVAGIYNRGYASHGVLPAPLNLDICRQVIGSGGKYLHVTTDKCQVDFIWHDKESNTFLFFGGHKGVIKAMYAINHRIKICTERQAEGVVCPSEEPSDQEVPTPSDDQAYDCFYCLEHSDVRLKKCSNCKVARYCDSVCQKADWKNHKCECLENVD